MTSHVIAYRSKELLFGMHAFNFNCFLDDFNCLFMQIRCLSVLLLMNGSLMQVKSIPLEHFAILFTCIKAIIGLENQFVVFLRVAVLDKFSVNPTCSVKDEILGHNEGFYPKTFKASK